MALLRSEENTCLHEPIQLVVTKPTVTEIKRGLFGTTRQAKAYRTSCEVLLYLQLCDSNRSTIFISCAKRRSFVVTSSFFKSAF